MTRLKTFVSTWNIFKPLPVSDEEDYQEQLRLSILSSTVFYILLCMLLFSFGFLTLITEQTFIVNIENPTIEQFEALPTEAQCPCFQNIVSYGDFVRMETTFHQVCASDFVTERWLRALYHGRNSTAFKSIDFRTSAHGAFESLTTLCHLAKSIVERSISLFYQKQLVNKNTLRENVVIKEISTIVEQFQLNLASQFRNRLKILDVLFLADRLISALPLNTMPIYFVHDSNSFSLYLMPSGTFYENNEVCDCRMNFECSSSTSIYETLETDNILSGIQQNILMNIPGFQMGCFPFNTLSVSSLECFFDRLCLNNLTFHLNTQETFEPLSSAEKSRFNLTSPIRFIAEQLFIENWSHTVFYEHYYSQCAPQLCSYSINKRFNVELTVFKLIGLLSGLTAILRFIVPNLVVRFSKFFNRRPPIPIPNNIGPSIGLKRKIYNAIQELNLFNDLNDDRRQIHHQRIATRLYIIAVIISVLSIVVHTALQMKTYKVTKLFPIFLSYIKLQNSYPETLFCPCKTISFDYKTFISINPEFHQICSSDLVSDAWLKYNLVDATQFYEPDDYFYQATARFALLSTLCEVAKRNINESLTIYLQKQYISSSVISKLIFESQIQASADDWRSSMTYEFFLNIELYQKMIIGNFLSNGDMNVDYLTDMETRQIQMVPKTDRDCTCGLLSFCLEEASIYDRSIDQNTTVRFKVPYFYNGCFRLQSFFVSTLECFYNHTCMVDIDRYKTDSLGHSFNFSALNPNRSSPHETLESIVKKMMVYAWSTNISYEAYYDACQPISCSYEYTSRSSLLTIIVTVLGMFGGVSLGFKLLIVITLKLIKRVEQGFTRENFIRTMKQLFQCPSEAEKITRLHIISAMLTLIIVYSLTAFTLQKTIISISRPTITVYEDLLRKHPTTLECMCSKTLFEYETFTSITAVFHQVCSSDFVSTSWIDYLYESQISSFQYAHLDFKYSGYAQFRLLSDLCQMTTTTLGKSIEQIRNDAFKSIRIIPESAIRYQILLKIDTFSQNLGDGFINMFTLIRTLISSNKLISVLSTSWIYDTPADIHHLWTVHRSPMEYDNCSCGYSSACFQQSRGLLSGCYPIESILKTEFTCLFDQECIDPSQKFKALNASLLVESRFRINDTIEEVLNKMMLEKYEVDISFENYFNECAPITCSYSYIDRNNPIDGLTKMISLYGGLMIICHVFAILFIKVILFRPIAH